MPSWVHKTRGTRAKAVLAVLCERAVPFWKRAHAEHLQAESHLLAIGCSFSRWAPALAL